MIILLEFNLNYKIIQNSFLFSMSIVDKRQKYFLNDYQKFDCYIYLYRQQKQMKLGRYNESPISTSFLQNSNKITPRSLHNSMTKNPEHTSDSMKLPSLSMSMRKSAISFTTQRNTRNQLSAITQKVQQMQAQIHNTRMDANQTLNHMRFLKQELVENKLAKDNEDLKSQISGLKRLLHITKQSHQNRSNQLREDYIRLWNQTQQLRQMIFGLKIRMDHVEDTMGSKV